MRKCKEGYVDCRAETSRGTVTHLGQRQSDPPWLLFGFEVPVVVKNGRVHSVRDGPGFDGLVIEPQTEVVPWLTRFVSSGIK